MDHDQKKAVQNAFKQKKTVGGIYCIKNAETGKILLQAAHNLEAKKNLLEFSQKIKSCSITELCEDWEKYGGDVFSFMVLDELEKGEEQSRKAFSKDLQELLSIWEQKLTGESFYVPLKSKP